MLTLHRAATLRTAPTAPPVTDGAVLVRGDLVAAVGPYPELAAAHPTARVREWDGELTPGLANPFGHLLLDLTYHPDPRDQDDPDDPDEPADGGARDWGASARRGLQQLLAHGTTALAGPFERPAVRTAVSRSGLPPVPPFAAPAASQAPGFAAGVPHGVLVPGGRADFAVFARPDGACVATVLAGRLVHRRR